VTCVSGAMLVVSCEGPESLPGSQLVLCNGRADLWTKTVCCISTLSQVDIKIAPVQILRSPFLRHSGVSSNAMLLLMVRLLLLGFSIPEGPFGDFPD